MKRVTRRQFAGKVLKGLGMTAGVLSGATLFNKAIAKVEKKSFLDGIYLKVDTLKLDGLPIYDTGAEEGRLSRVMIPIFEPKYSVNHYLKKAVKFHKELIEQTDLTEALVVKYVDENIMGILITNSKGRVCVLDSGCSLSGEHTYKGVIETENRVKQYRS